MTPYDYRRIPLSLVDISTSRLRRIRPERVEVLAKDMAANGQLQPIVVVETEDGRFDLDDGALRVAALRSAKAYEVDARVTPIAALRPEERRLREIMANLDREDFTALENAEALTELKRVYEILHPETRKGGDRGNQHTGGKKSQNEIFSFSQIAAEATGLSRRSIELAVKVWAGLTLVSKERLRGTAIERKQADLRALAEVAPEIQTKALDLLLAQPAEAGSVAEALALAQGIKLDSPEERTFRNVVDHWVRFARPQKRAFVRANRDEIVTILREEGDL